MTAVANATLEINLLIRMISPYGERLKRHMNIMAIIEDAA